jgi:hypothetical protein
MLDEMRTYGDEGEDSGKGLMFSCCKAARPSRFSVWLWDAVTGAALQTLEGHGGIVIRDFRNERRARNAQSDAEDSRQTGAVLASFFSQIERQNASSLRHICIHLLDFDPESAVLQEDSIKSMELIQDNCTSIATLEISLHITFRSEYAAANAADALDLLDTRFKAISSLKEVIIDVHVYGDNSLRDDLREKMCDYGWTIKVTQSMTAPFIIIELSSGYEWSLIGEEWPPMDENWEVP